MGNKSQQNVVINGNGVHTPMVQPATQPMVDLNFKIPASLITVSPDGKYYNITGAHQTASIEGRLGNTPALLNFSIYREGGKWQLIIPVDGLKERQGKTEQPVARPLSDADRAKLGF